MAESAKRDLLMHRVMASYIITMIRSNRDPLSIGLQQKAISESAKFAV